MTLHCEVCQADTDAYLCRRCTDEIERALAELPHDLADLEAVATRQAAGPLGLGDPARQWDGPREAGALGDAGWVFAPGAADQLWVVQNTTTTWARHLLERSDMWPLPPVPAGPTCERCRHDSCKRAELIRRLTGAPAHRQLLNLLDSIRYDEAAAQLHDELTSLPVENCRWIMPPPPEEEFHGLCDAADVAATLDDGRVSLSVGRCGTQLWSREKAQRIDCPVCGASYTRAERQASMLAELADTLGTVAQVASTLTKLGRPVTINQVRGWLRRGMIAGRGANPVMIRFGDVLDHRAAVLARGQTRRERTAA